MSRKAEWIEGFRDELRRSWKVLRLHEQRALIGISGGADSFTLLALSASIGIELEAATVDHGLRPESAAEAARVAEWCSANHITHHTLTVKVEGAGLEARARHERYTALHQLRLQRGLDLLATGHTADDQAETLVMRLSRGAALQGARSIHRARSDATVRPLLFARRAETQRCAAELELPVQHDRMNDDARFLRVRVRDQVLPALETAVGAHAVPALARFAELAAEDEAYLDELTDHAQRRVWGAEGVLRIELLALPRPLARRVVARWLSKAGLERSAAVIEEVLAACAGKRLATLPGDRLLDATGDCLTIRPAPMRRASRNSL